jgi:hypothetical protein
MRSSILIWRSSGVQTSGWYFLYTCMYGVFSSVTSTSGGCGGHQNAERSNSLVNGGEPSIPPSFAQPI